MQLEVIGLRIDSASRPDEQQVIINQDVQLSYIALQHGNAKSLFVFLNLHERQFSRYQHNASQAGPQSAVGLSD